MHLVTCDDDDSMVERLDLAVGQAGRTSERAKSTAGGGESATPGRFPAIVLTPILGDRSWGRLIDLASRYEDLGFTVILVASTSDLNQWLEALADGSLRRDGAPLDKLPIRRVG